MDTSLTLLLCVVCIAGHSYVKGDTVFTSNGTHILKISTASDDVSVFMHQGLHHVVGLAIDARGDILFFSDVARKHERIGRANLQNGNARTIVTDIGVVNCLAVDWVAKLLYWTDEHRLTIEVADYEGRYRKTIVDTDLIRPRGIATDPGTGTLFWADQGMRIIERSSLSGTNRRTVVETGLRWPNQLSFHSAKKRLFWVDGYYTSIDSTLASPSARKTNHRRFSPTSFMRNPLFGLAAVGDKAYFTAWDGGLYVSDLVQNVKKQYRQSTRQLSRRHVFSIAIKDESLQPMSRHVCGQPGRGSCDQLCLITGPETYECACATFGGRMLGDNKRSCEEPRDFLLVADCLAGVVRMLPSDRRDNSTHLVVRSACPTAVTYDLVDGRVVWSDKREKAIYSIALDGSERRTLLSANDGIDRVDSLAMDWQHKRLYFTSCGCSRPKRDGNVYVWQTVESIGLTGSNRRVVTTAIRQPTTLVLDLPHSHIYIIEGSNPAILWRSQLDGHDPVQIKRLVGTGAKDWLTISDDVLHVWRANIANETYTRHELYNTSSRNWITTEHSAQPAIRQDKVKIQCITSKKSATFVTDTSLKLRKTVLRRLNLGIISSSVKSCTSMVYVDEKRQSIQDDHDACVGSRCSHICVPTPGKHPRAVNYACLCPEASFLTLGYTATTCSEPKMYALFADMNTIKLIGLDDGAQDLGVYTFIYGPTDAHYMALCLDRSTDTLYFSDLTSNAILTAELQTRNATVFYKSNMSVNGLALGGHRIYWTCYDTRTLKGSIMSRSTGGKSETAQVVATNLYQPRALAVDINSNGRGHIYWTEYGQSDTSGVPPRVCRMTTPSGDVEVLKMPGRSSWPNGLAVAGNSLYFADGYTKVIERMDKTDKRWTPVTLNNHVIDHVYGLTVTETGLLFYTSWWSPRVCLASVDGGQVVVLGDNTTNVFQPSSVVVHL